MLKIGDRCAQIVEPIGGAIAVLIAIILFLQVVTRYVIHYSIPWSEEICGFLFVWLIFLGSIVAYKDGQLLRLTYFRDKLPASLQLIVETIMNITVLIGLVAVIMKGTEAALMASSRKTSYLLFSWMYIYMALPVGFSFLAIGYFESLIDNLKAIKGLFLSKES